MNDKERLLREIAQVDFAMWELHIYLDTHPNDMTAMALHNANEKKLAVLVAEYTSKYGPLNTKGVTKDNRWLWISDPWPWDYSSQGGL